MNRTLIALTFCALATANCFAEDSVSGIYSHSYRIKGHPFGNVAFGSSIEIKKLDAFNVQVQITLNEATAGSSCGGGINGVGQLVNHQIIIEKKDGEETCHVEILIDKRGAHITSENNCSAFH